ncbi:MAG: argininosuccinate synthase [Deltaproteobacteria bacterium]|nr:argininosuccinate synthase [Deltaproteobacteria bacterium]
MGQQTVVLAYSGGLDTSCLLKWLKLKGFRVIAYVADVGQEDDFEEVRTRALKTGADDVLVVDMKEEFVTDFIFPAIQGDAIYEGRYLLGTSLARPLIAKHQIEVARRYEAEWVAHGATGKGNDQVRFEVAYAALAPTIGVYHVWKNPEFLSQFQGRSDLIAFAREHSVDIPVTLERPFSTDENLMHKSYESGVLEDPMMQPDPEIFTVCRDPRDAPDRETLLEIHFKDGRPIRVKNLDDGREETEPLPLFMYLNELGGENAIGRIDIVENRFVGIKSRGIYETPGGTILHAALRDLEGIAMDKEVRRLRDMLAPELAAIIYNGFWFSPEMDFLMAAVQKSQEIIDGFVRLKLYKGNVMPVGRASPSSLYDKELSSMDIAGGFDQVDSLGFIRINALRLMAHRVILREEGGK